MRVLIVTNPFGGHSKGSVIKDADKIAEILAGENAHHVISAHHADDAPPSGPADSHGE